MSKMMSDSADELMPEADVGSSIHKDVFDVLLHNVRSFPLFLRNSDVYLQTALCCMPTLTANWSSQESMLVSSMCRCAAQHCWHLVQAKEQCTPAVSGTCTFASPRHRASVPIHCATACKLCVGAH
jgi:hypothetical protein